ncbi:MAG: heavy metal translocating P-type ATPase metal-binding domain-containing protein [Capnocytophaga sp.]|nr:heavy metal translocating P-type ATPase metal-binding domain-containing protein [Capnocytophaga sp.]
MEINTTTCYHCGNECDPNTPIRIEDKNFCCLGCKTVYEILSENNLETYYKFEKSPGSRPEYSAQKYDFLDNEKIKEKLLEFDNDNTQIVSLYIPSIHCSSCIWILENLQKLHNGIIHSLVNFPKKTVQITYHSDKISLKELALLLSHIGYAPYISLDDYQKKETNKQMKQLLYKLGVAGFGFGNVMLLSFPGFFETDEFWFNEYKHFFRWLMFALTLPVLFYSASDYFISAYKGIRSRILNIDIPLALGILAMSLRSSYDIITDSGQGFFDSLNSLVFLLLIGKFFQQRTYSFLSFERDYKSYFPIGVTRIKKDGKEESVQVYDISEGDRLLIRNEELLPVDCILVNGEAQIDYSFVTGESKSIEKQSGDKLFAGGKQKGQAIEVEAIKNVSQSYLTQLWSNEVFKKDKFLGVKTLTDKISKYFTITILLVAFGSLLYWLYFGSIKEAFNVFTAVLIIACPCALAVSAPFALGNMLRIFGRYKLYLKDTKVIEQMDKIDTIIFDKTGTITTASENRIRYEGEEFSDREYSILKNVLRNSNHPLSRQIYDCIPNIEKLEITNFQEISGKGMIATYEDIEIKIGSSSFIIAEPNNLETSVYISINNKYKGKYIFENEYRKGMKELFSSLSKRYDLVILSGDNESERENLSQWLPQNTKVYFNQSPKDKLTYIDSLQEKNKKVLMIGDGLNDAGALKQSDIGFAVSENINIFSPACDGIMDAQKLHKLDRFLLLSKQSLRIIHWSFVISLCYNCIGLGFAISGKLEPVVAAILMPISSISVVLFTTFATNFLGRKKL